MSSNRESSAWLPTAVEYLRRLLRRPGAVVNGQELRLETRRDSDLPALVVAGRVTIDSSPRLRQALQDTLETASATTVAIDVSGTSFLDTSGVATLIEVAQVASARGLVLHLIGLDGEPRIVAETAELDRIYRALGHEVPLP